MPHSTPERILQRLDWQVIRRLDGILQGDYRTLFYGFGLDLADVREYQDGDDVRLIDWNVTARMTTPYVRQYSEDRELTAWFLLDLSPSVDFGKVDTLKRNQIINVTTTLARLLTRHGNRVGAMIYSNRVEHILPARGGRLQVLQLTNLLLKQEKKKAGTATDLKPLLESARRMIKQRSLVFVISDFISAPGWERPLRLLGQRNEVLAIKVSDPRERELPNLGWAVMEDAETGEQLLVNTGDGKFRQRFEAAAERREREIEGSFRTAQIDAFSLSTEDDLVQAIVRFASKRKNKVVRVSNARQMEVRL